MHASHAPPNTLNHTRVQVAYGYLARPALTAEKFVANPHGAPGLMYRTGDLGIVDGAGCFSYHGRADRQVKIGGVRMELGEIEAVCLRIFPRLSNVAIEKVGDKLVGVAAAVADQELPAAGEINALLAGRLPAPYIPSEWLFRDALPLGSAGKVDHNKVRAFFCFCFLLLFIYLILLLLRSAQPWHHAGPVQPSASLCRTPARAARFDPPVLAPKTLPSRRAKQVVAWIADQHKLNMWGSIYDEMYFADQFQVQDLADNDPTMDWASYYDSFTGKMHERPTIEEWVNETVDEINERKPTSIIEMGCGKVAPKPAAPAPAPAPVAAAAAAAAP